MINILINNSSLSMPDSWEEFSLNDAIKLRKLLNKLDDSSYENLSGDEISRQILEIFNFEMALEQLDFKTIWDISLESFVNGLTGESDYQIRNIGQFEHGNFIYYLPLIDNIRTDTFCKINTLYSQNPLENISKICALIYSSEEDFQEYDNIKMDVVFELFNYICKINKELNDSFPIICNTSESHSNLNLDSWEQLIIYTANEVPTEITHLKNCNCREFMQLLSYKLKKNGL